MSIMGSITNGAPKTGQRIVISGVEKVGKTTLACNTPRPLLVPMEMGFASQTCHKTKVIESFEEVLSFMGEVGPLWSRNQFPFQSIVFDSATALERLIHDNVLRSDPAYVKNNAKGVTMESALGGYGKAYMRANELFGRFTDACDQLAIHAGINIIITCHVFAAKVIDPAYGEYDTWDLLLHSPKNQKNYGKREMITQWADMVGFLHEPIFVMKTEKGETLKRGVDQEKGRVIAVDRSPGWVAGNRYGISGEIPIPSVNGWNYLAQKIFDARGIDMFNRDAVA